MKVATWNVNGIRARAEQFCAWLDEHRPDVVCLQELKAEAEQIPPQCVHPGYHTFWHGMKGYSGVSLHIARYRAEEAPDFLHPEFDVDARFVFAPVGSLVFASVYVPNGGKDFAQKIDFLNAMIGWARGLRAAGKSVLICGDINVARAEIDVHPRERKPTAVGQRPDERALFQQLLDAGLVDLGRTLDPENDRLFTWWAPWRNMRARNIGWRLDYLLASPDIADRAIRCEVQRDVGTSDHAPVVLEFADSA